MTFWFKIVIDLARMHPVLYRMGKGKGKTITLQTWTGPEVSRRLRLSDFQTIGT